MSPRSAFKNMFNCRLAAIKAHSYLSDAKSALAHFPDIKNVLFGKYGMRMHLTPGISPAKNIKSMALIFALRGPLKILKRIIFGVSVKMVALNVLLAHSTKCRKHQSANVPSSPEFLVTQNNCHISRRISSWRQNLFSGNSPSTIKKAFDAPKVTDLIKMRPSRDWFPVLHNRMLSRIDP